MDLAICVQKERLSGALGLFVWYDSIVIYTLRENARARHINVTVRRDGTVWVTKPKRVPMREVERFVEKCGEWIARAQEKFSKLPKTSRIESSQKEYAKYKHAARAEVARRN